MRDDVYEALPVTRQAGAECVKPGNVIQVQLRLI